MTSLSPKLQSGIGFEQPVQQPSFMSGVADLAGMFVNTSKPKQASTGDILAADKSNFYNDLQKGRSLIEQGKAQQGNSTIQKAYRNFSRRYGREHEDVNTAFTDATGISFDVEVTGSPVDYEAITSTPDFAIAASVVQAKNPDASPDQVYQLALQKETLRLATDAQINEYEQAEKVNWFEAEDTYVQKARQAGDTIRGLLEGAQKDQVITPDEAQGIRSFYQNMYGSITKPVGVEQERWDKYQEEYINPLTQIVEGTIGVAQGQGLSQDMTRSLDQMVSKAVAQGKLPASLLVKMKGDSADSFEAFTQLLGQAAVNSTNTENYNFVMNATFDEMLDWVTEFKFKTDTDSLKIDTIEYDGLDNTKKRESLLNGVNLIAPNAGPEQISLDLLNTNAKLERLASRALQPGDFGKVFNPAYFEGIDKVFKENPIIGRQIAQDAVDAISIQEVNISRALNSEMKQLGFKNVGGKVIPDPESMDKTNQITVDKYFGGDWAMAVQSGGKDSSGITHSAIKAIADTARDSLQPKLDKFMGAKKVVEALSSRFLTEDVTGSTEVEGSAGEDVLQDTDTGGIQPLLGLIDKTEGGGDYDTLFGFSQKGGREFAGVKPSEMTIGELKRFASPSGSYGQWVKGKVGRVATPMGRYQFVGTTLAATAKKMGLPDTAVFDQRTQDAMFAFKVRERLSKKSSPEGKREALRAEWEGFKSASNAELDNAIASFENGAPVDFGGITVASGNTAPATSERPEVSAMRTQVAEGGAPLQGGSTGGSGGTLEGQEVAQGDTPTSGAGEDSTGTSPERAEQVWSELSQQTKGLLLRLFGNEEGVREALIKGEITEEELA